MPRASRRWRRDICRSCSPVWHDLYQQHLYGVHWLPWLIQSGRGHLLEQGGGNGRDCAGGAYFWGQATLTGTTFLSNTFVNSISTADAGGAVFEGVATVTGALFRGNRAWTGGAHFGGAVTVMDTQFISNTALNRGGGALFRGESTVIGTYFWKTGR